MIKVERKPDGSYGTMEPCELRTWLTKRNHLTTHVFSTPSTVPYRREGLVYEHGWYDPVETRRSPDFNKGSMILVTG
jgi:hypothetical protein